MIDEMRLAGAHPGITGGNRESMWLQLFRRIVPQKFSEATGVLIIDSLGNVSNEIDIAFIDEQYTPYIFRYNELKFIPIEAVAVVIECKSKSTNIEQIKEWTKSIKNLRTSPTGLARMVNSMTLGATNTTQKATRPIKVLASLDPSDKNNEEFDFVIHPKNSIEVEENRFVLYTNHEDSSLDYWQKELVGTSGNPDKKGLEILKPRGYEQLEQKLKDYNELQFGDDDSGSICLLNSLSDLKIEGNALLTLNLQLNQLLMLLNNPMLFPHFSYAKRFKEIIREHTEKA
jgi:hypothetical protein